MKLSNMKPSNIKLRNQQRGATLIVALIMLLVLTLLGFSSSQSVLMQEKMTFAVQDGHVALQSAELGLSEAEDYIEDNVTTLINFTNNGQGAVNGLYSQGNGPDSVFAVANWDPNVITYQQAGSTVHSDVDAPLFYIEDLGITVNIGANAAMNMTGYGQTSGQGDVNTFRIVSRGAGRSGTTDRYIISHYGKRL